MRAQLPFGDSLLLIEDSGAVEFEGTSLAVEIAGLEWVPGESEDDADVALRTLSSGDLRLRVRHFVGANWELRVTLANEGEAPLSTPGLTLHSQLPSGRGCWMFGGGAVGALLLHDPRGGPVLLLRAKLGELTDAGDVIRLSPEVLTLPPGGRYTVLLQGELLERWPGAESVLPAWLPELALAADEELELALPDVVVQAASGLSLTQEDEWTRVTGRGTQRLVLDGVGGTSRFDVHWAPTLEAALHSAAARLLRIPEPGSFPEAWLLQRALAVGLVDEPDLAHDSLDRGLDQMASAPGDWWPALVWAGEVARTSERSSYERLRLALAEISPRLGAGLACLKSYVVLLAAGVDPTPAQDALAGISRSVPEAGLATAELALLSGRADSLAGAAELLGRELGHGWPGRPLGRPPEDEALAVALTGLLPEESREVDLVELAHAGEAVTRRLLCGPPSAATLGNLLLRPE